MFRFIESLRKSSRPPWFLPAVVLLVGSVLSVLAHLVIVRQVDEADREYFQYTVLRREDSIRDRIQTFITILRGASGILGGRQIVPRNRFRSYVERLMLDKNYPGIQGVGVSWRFSKKDEDFYTTFVRNEGMTVKRPEEPEKPFEIWPRENGRDQHAIVYLEPLDERNHAAIGFNMHSQPVRRKAMHRARDTGKPAASGKVTLVQEIDEIKQAGFLIFLPLYRGAAIPATVRERRQRLVGFAYSPFRTDDLLQATYRNDRPAQVDLAIYDGTQILPEALLHSSSAEVEAEQAQRLFREVRTLDVAGRPWTIVYTSGPSFGGLSTRSLALIVFPVGLAATGLLAWLSWREARAHERARLVAADLRATSETLRSTLTMSKAILDGALDCIIAIDNSGSITEFNPAAERTFGYGREEVLGRRLDQTILPDDVQPAESSTFRQYLSLAKEHDGGQRVEIAARHKDGTVFPVELTITRMVGDAAAFTAFVRDVTELRRAERLLRREAEEKEQLLASERAARNHAERADRLKDEFLSTVSHELRTPLNAILGWAQLLKIGQLEEAEISQGLEVIERNVRVQAQIIEDLLDMSRIVSGKIRLVTKRTNLVKVIEAAIATVSPAADAKDIRFEKSLDAYAGPVTGDANRLQQVVWNLLANAIKFTPQGGRVEVTLKRRDSVAELTVADTGQGIEPEFLPHVFDRFRQADSSTTRIHGGLGLGLAIVKQLVELHGGAVRADSKGEGQGASFTVTLPLAMLADGDSDGIDQHDGDSYGSAKYERPALCGVKVLAVDDEPDGLQVVKRFLEECQATVFTATSAAEGLKLFEQEKPHVVLSDIGMPEQNGYEFIRAIRSRAPEDGGAVPAAAVTAFARSEDRRRAMIAGYQTHISKPVEPAELVAVVAALAGRTGR
jgi:PAS domain S-box-containing protein